MAKKVTAKLTEKRTEQTIERSIELPTDVGESYRTIILPDKSYFGKPFVTVFKDALLTIIKHAKLTKNELTLLCYLIASISHENTVITDLNEICSDLGIDKGNACRALNGLIKRNIVIKKAGRKGYKKPTTIGLELNFNQLNYNLAYNGKISKYAEHKVEHPAITDTSGNLLSAVAAENDRIKQLAENEAEQKRIIDSMTTIMTSDGCEYDKETGVLLWSPSAKDYDEEIEDVEISE